MELTLIVGEISTIFINNVETQKQDVMKDIQQNSTMRHKHELKTSELEILRLSQKESF